MTILEDLWYGNVRPTERSIVRGSKLDNLMKLLCQNEDDLMSGLTEKQKESFDKFKDCQSEMKEHKVIDDEACSNIESEFFEILCVLAKRQSENIEQDKPTHKFIRKLYALIDSGSAVIINRNFEPNATPNNLIGYEDDDYYYLNKTAAHRVVKKLCDEQSESFTITEKGLLKALAEEKLIDTAEGQNTKSVRIGGKTKRVVCLIKSKSDPIADTT